MALNITTAVIGSGCNTATATPSLAQWDQGQVLKIEGVDLPSTYQVEFSTEYTRNAIPQIGDENGVAIPNELLQRSAPITAYIVLHEGLNDREREYWITIYITPGTPPETITPDPEQMDVIDETIAALQDGVAAAEAAAQSVQNMGVEAETLTPGSPLTVTKEVDPETGAVTLIFGLTQGPKGDDGYSPTITITEITGGHRFTVTDKTHPSGQSFDVLDGTKGDKGDDGYSPEVTITTITGGHRVTITDKDHPQGQSFDVMDGQGGGGAVNDVQIDGNSIVSGGVADIPLATASSPGLSYPYSNRGLSINADGQISVTKASDNSIKAGSAQYAPIVPSNQHGASFYGLAKAAGDATQAASDNPVGTYTDGAKAAIKDMIGATAGGIGFDDSDTYPSGSVGAELSSQKNAISQKETKTTYTTLSGTTVTQTGKDHVMYLCGELATLSFTAPASGITAIRFSSGTTATVYTLNGVQMPDDWPVTTQSGSSISGTLDANKTYEINVLDGKGVYASWS